MRKLSLATAVVASFAFVPSAMAATLTGVHTTWLDTRTNTPYQIICNETQTGSGSSRSESFNCTPDGAKAPAGTYTSPKSFWYSDFDGATAKKVNVTIDSNGNLTGTASNFGSPATFRTTWTDTRTGKVYNITCTETRSMNGSQTTENLNCKPNGKKAPAGTYDSAHGAFWQSDFDGRMADSVHVVIDNKGNLTGTAVYN